MEFKNEVLEGRHIRYFNRRLLRFLPEHADSQSAAKRHSRDAQNHAATSCRGCESGSSPDDVPRPELRSPCDRWKRGGHISRKSKGVHRGSKEVAARFLDWGAHAPRVYVSTPSSKSIQWKTPMEYG